MGRISRELLDEIVKKKQCDDCSPIKIVAQIQPATTPNQFASSLDQFEKAGAELVQASQSLRQVVMVIDDNHLSDLAEHPLVKNVNEVRRFTLSPLDQVSLPFLAGEASDLRPLTMTEAGRLLGGGALKDQGYTGAGWRIAVVDSGICVRSPLLTDAVEEARIFTGGSEHPAFFHGTAVASILAGQMWSDLEGVAPGVKLLDVRVFDEDSTTYEAVMAGLDYAIEKRVNAVNMSFGTAEPYEPLRGAVRAMRVKGIIPIGASGNNGLIAGTESPSDFREALCVGSVDSATKERSYFSAQGPSEDGSAKPDLAAYGGSGGEALVCGGLGESIIQVQGTSFAAPQVTGLLALLWEKFRRSPEGLLVASTGVTRKNNQTGWGIPEVSALTGTESPPYGGGGVNPLWAVGAVAGVGGLLYLASRGRRRV